MSRRSSGRPGGAHSVVARSQVEVPPSEGRLGTVLVDGSEVLPLLADAGLRPPEWSLSVATFSAADVEDTSFWLKIGLLDRPRFLTPPKEMRDSVLVANDRQFV